MQHNIVHLSMIQTSVYFTYILYTRYPDLFRIFTSMTVSLPINRFECFKTIDWEGNGSLSEIFYFL